MAGDGGANRWRRARVATVLVALVAQGVSGCTPPAHRATVFNDTTVTLVPDGARLEGAEIPPGAKGEVRWYGERCEDELAFGTAERTSTVVVSGPVCDRDTVTASRDHVIDASATATVRNDSTHALTAGIWDGHPTATSLRDIALAAGEELTVALMLPAGSCAGGAVFATVVDDPVVDDPEIYINSPDEGRRVVVHPGEWCDGDVWVIDDAAVDAGSAVVALTNRTDRELRIWFGTPDWSFDTWIAPGVSVDMTLGAQPGECVEGAVYGESAAQRGVETLRLERQGPICPGEWEITEADLTHYERGRGWVPVVPATEG